ncbi:MAG: alpha-galactosidase [Armatimonadota bacterium]|nr:MAG: alpha-galactosidase [Armatimonadota bacterium]
MTLALSASAQSSAARLPDPLAGEFHLSIDRAGHRTVLSPEQADRVPGGCDWKVGVLQVSARARRQPHDPAAWIVRATVTNNGRRTVRMDAMELTLNGLVEAPPLVPLREPGVRVFLDSGWLGGSTVRDLNVADARHESHGVSVLVDGQRETALAAGFLSFRDAAVTLALSCDREGRWCGLAARSEFVNGRGLEPGKTLQSEALWLRLCDTGHDGLERWADAVVRFNRLPPPRARASGWNSWYAYRLTTTEDLILANARIVAERFKEYGATNMQIDHGWQDRDIVGNWVPNTRFPHGLPWLSERLREMGLTLGLWTAVSQVSEFAPLFAEHPEALLHDAAGALSVADQHWFWEPHGKTYTPDPTHPLGLAFYRDAGRKLRSYGAVYVKNDFQGNLFRRDVVPHDAAATLGPPLYLRAMRAFQQGMGREMIRHGCNAPLNIGAGMWDAAWVHRDIGNPRGDWESLAGFAHELACRYHVNGKFYWCDPDYLQVGQGEPNETRVRMALMALGGGTAFICDRLPELPEEKLRLISRCLPGYGAAAVPLDLFDRDSYPRIRWLDVGTAWGRWAVAGVFNLDDEPVEIDLPLDRAPARGDLYAFAFFSSSLLTPEPLPRNEPLRVSVPARDVRVIRIASMPDHPWVIGTDLHLTQGGVELEHVRWDARGKTLSMQAHRATGERGHFFIRVPPAYRPTSGRADSAGILRVPVVFTEPRITCRVKFEHAASAGKPRG